jgi:hypothetical protein
MSFWNFFLWYSLIGTLSPNVFESICFLRQLSLIRCKTLLLLIRTTSRIIAFCIFCMSKWILWILLLINEKSFPKLAIKFVQFMILFLMWEIILKLFNFVLLIIKWFTGIVRLARKSLKQGGLCPRLLPQLVPFQIRCRITKRWLLTNLRELIGINIVCKNLSILFKTSKLDIIMQMCGNWMISKKSSLLLLLM